MGAVWATASVSGVLAVFVHAGYIEGRLQGGWQATWRWILVDAFLAGLPVLLALVVWAIRQRESKSAAWPTGLAALIGSVISLACAVYWI